jgi:transcriptional regulator with XRE-family HTH domain
MSRVKKSAEEIEEAKLLGKALAALRVSRGMTQGQVAAQAGLTPQRICKAERGSCYPQRIHLKRILAGMGVTFAALHRAQELVLDPMGESAEPIDSPDFTPEEAHQAALRLAQEAGKAVAHCCLSFMEMGARGWRLNGNAGNGRSRATE